MLKLWGNREPEGEDVYGKFVGIACVWRIDYQDKPMLDRAFDGGTRRHDIRQETATTLRRLQDRSCSMRFALAIAQATETRHRHDARRASRASSALQHPGPRGRASLRLRAPPLHPKRDTPTFEVNVYDLLLELNRFETDWSTPRA